MSSRHSHKKHRRSSAGRIIGTLIAILVLCALAVFLADGRSAVISMNGDTEIYLEYGSDYSDAGASVTTVGRLFGRQDIESAELITDNSVHTGKLGDYTVEYSTRFLMFPEKCVRTVHIVDTTPPELILNEDTHSSWIEGYTEAGFTAYDAVDGDMTDKVQVTQEGDAVVYTVTDSSGNTATDSRDIGLIFELSGDENTFITLGSLYEDEGVIAKDGLGNDLSAYVTVESGEMCRWQMGEYGIDYTIENKAGEVRTLHRTVAYEKAEPYVTIDPGAKTIYLTFDDGPSRFTEQLLDTLDKYEDVHVTFFVTGWEWDKYSDQVKRAYESGHSIGIHSKCHSSVDIYASEEAYFEDFFAMDQLIYDKIGIHTKLCRFPGGGSNMGSSFNPGIMTRLIGILTDMGYKYFDWNAVSGDTTENTDEWVSGLVASSVIGCCDYNNDNGKASVVLQHDTQGFSVAAVERIIIWGLENGYTFEALDTTSPEAHQRVAN